MVVVKNKTKRIPNKDSTYKYKDKTYRNPADVKAAIKQNLMQSESVQNILATQRGNASETSSGRRINPVKQDVVSKGENINLGTSSADNQISQMPKNQVSQGDNIQLDPTQNLSKVQQQQINRIDGYVASGKYTEEKGEILKSDILLQSQEDRKWYDNPPEFQDVMLAAGATGLAGNAVNMVITKFSQIGASIASGTISGNTANAAAGKLGQLNFKGGKMFQVIPEAGKKVTGKAALAVTDTSGATINYARTVIVNPKTQELTGNYLMRMVGAVKNPRLVTSALLGIVGSMAFISFSWGPDTAADTSRMLSMAGDRAEELEDWDELDKITEYITAADNINSRLPWNMPGLVALNYKALLSKNRMNQEQKRLALKGESAKQLEDAKWKQKAEDDAAIEQEKRDYYAERTKESRDYNQRLRENEKIAKDEERKEDEAYWTNLRKEQEIRDEADRKENEAYWAAVRKKKEEDRPSKLNFGIL